MILIPTLILLVEHEIVILVYDSECKRNLISPYEKEVFLIESFCHLSF